MAIGAGGRTGLALHDAYTIHSTQFMHAYNYMEHAHAMQMRAHSIAARARARRRVHTRTLLVHACSHQHYTSGLIIQQAQSQNSRMLHIV